MMRIDSPATPAPDASPPSRLAGLRPYLGPLVAGLLMLALVAGWATNEGFEIQRRREEQLRRFGESFVLFFDASVHQGSVPLDDPLRAQSLLFILYSRAPAIHTATFEVDGKVVANVGEPLPDVERSTVEGEAVVGQQLVLWRRIRREPTGELLLPPPRLERGGPPPESPHTGDATSPLVTLVLDMEQASSVAEQRVWSVVVKVVLAALAILFMAGAWALGIRNRRIAAALALDRTRLAHLEELRFAAAGLAHETRNPLGIIRGLAQRIESRPQTDPDTARIAEQIVDAADRATERLGEFLHFARLGSPKMAEVELHEVLTEILDILRDDFDAEGITLNPRVQPVVVRADPEMLRQVVVNLLLNSLHASDAGDTVTVEVETPSPGAVTLSIKDEGCGIPPHLAQDVFKPYVTGTDDGNGLGLAIVQRIADEHGWHIHLETAVDQGTTIALSGIQRTSP